jgi:hypothetical protein
MTARQAYLLHAAEPIGNPFNPHAMAQHYLGYGYDLERRIAEQLAATGTRPLWCGRSVRRAYPCSWRGPGRARVERSSGS